MEFDPGATVPGATAWVLVSAALVLFMAPGVTFFYAGMVRTKSVLGMIMQGFVTIALVGCVWVLISFSLAFDEGNAFIGGLHFVGLGNPDDIIPGFVKGDALTVTPLTFAAFQMMFAIVTSAILIGAAADRWRFASFTLFMMLWPILVYAPVAHWVFSPLGWARSMGVLDFAGGLVVHINAGAAGLALALVLGRRRGWPEEPMPPHNLPMVLLGAAMLWFGWFGFNGGSALAADQAAAFAFVNTNTAAGAGLLAWICVERIRFGKSTTLGAASGAVSGLVGITPGAGFVTPLAAVAIGLLAGAVCALAVSVKNWLRLDDSLDVAGVHLVGGLVGSLAVALFATTSVAPDGKDGLFYGGGYGLLAKQTLATTAVLAYSFAVTYLIARFLDRVVGNRVPARTEVSGLDLAVHGESAYQTALHNIPQPPDGNPPSGGAAPSGTPARQGTARHSSSP